MQSIWSTQWQLFTCSRCSARKHVRGRLKTWHTLLQLTACLIAWLEASAKPDALIKAAQTGRIVYWDMRSPFRSVLKQRALFLTSVTYLARCAVCVHQLHQPYHLHPHHHHHHLRSKHGSWITVVSYDVDEGDGNGDMRMEKCES